MKVRFLISKLIKKIHLPAIKNSSIHGKSKICSGSHVVNSETGKYTYIGDFCTILNTSIGSFTSIASNCIIGGSSHPIKWVSTSPVFHDGKNILNRNFSNHNFKTSARTKVGNDVWIGNNCLIKAGVTIGNGAVVGMGSVVTKNVPDYEIWAGNPAKFIRKRFSDNQVEVLLDTKWWDKPDDEISKFANNMVSIDNFLESINIKK